VAERTIGRSICFDFSAGKNIIVDPLGRRLSLREYLLRFIGLIAIVVQNEVLYKKWETPNLKSNILQVIIPQKCIKRKLEEAHD